MIFHKVVDSNLYRQMKKIIYVISLLVLSLPIYTQSDENSVTVHGYFEERGDSRISPELMTILFIKEAGHVRADYVYRFILNDTSARMLGRDHIYAVPVNDVTYNGLYGVEDVELELIPVEGTNIYYGKKPSTTPEAPRFYCGFPYYHDDGTYDKFRDFFWDHPDKPQYIPLTLLYTPVDYKYTEQLVKALGSDVIIHPAANTRDGMKEEIPLKKIAAQHLASVRQLKVGAPNSDDPKEWERWHKELPNMPILFDHPDIETKAYVSKNFVYGLNFKQDSITGSVYGLYNDTIIYCLDRYGEFSRPNILLSGNRPVWVNARYSDIVYKNLKSMFPESLQVQVRPYYVSLPDNKCLFAVIMKPDLQEKLYLYTIDSVTGKMSDGVCIYTYLPLDNDRRKITLFNLFRTGTGSCIIFRVDNETIWLSVNDKDLL